MYIKVFETFIKIDSPDWRLNTLDLAMYGFYATRMVRKFN